MPDDIAHDFALRGWELISPLQINEDWERYRLYIQSSKAEFTCAKDQYVRLHTGWFSDRSACYLASGRPVITQDTGWSDLHSITKGVASFRSYDDIVNAVREIDSDYAMHSKAALEIAHEYFCAEKVLLQLLNQAGVGIP
jgi:hypothetical protein